MQAPFRVLCSNSAGFLTVRVVASLEVAMTTLFGIVSALHGVLDLDDVT